MDRQTLVKLAALGSALVMLGAGCPAAKKSTTPESAPTPLSAAAMDIKPGDLTVKAEATAPGTIKITWTAPADADPASVFRVLHSKNPNPALPNAVWFQRSDKAAREATLTGVKAGQRYLRVCEFKNDHCARYSNEVAVDVK